MPPKRRARAAAAEEEDEDDATIEGVPNANPVRAVANIFSLERSLIRDQVTGRLRVVDPLFASFIGAPGMTIMQSPVAILGARAQVLAFDPVLSPALKYLQRLALHAEVPVADATHNALLECVLAELATLFFFFKMSMTGTTQTHRTLSAQYSLLSCDARTLLATPANKIDDVMSRSLVSVILSSQGLETHANYPQVTTVAKPLAPLTIPAVFSNPASLPKRNRVPKFAQTCGKCQGKGHDAPACVSPHPGCKPEWNCGVCGGKGHSTRFCPSE